MIQQIIELERNDEQTKEQRTPKRTLKYIHNLRDDEAFEIEDSECYGHLIFLTPQPKKIIVMSEKEHDFDLVSYAANLIKGNASSNLNEIQVSITITYRSLIFNPVIFCKLPALR